MNSFIHKKSQRLEKFETMVERISEITDLDRNLVREIGEQALNTWEEDNQKDLRTIFTSDTEEKQYSINQIVTMFRDSLVPYIETRHVLDHVGRIAQYWYSSLYHTK